ncbi:2-deoxy-5-keto-D-gluconate 6-phosphate aldolase domain-containing protein [Caenimonas terrae]|uniref:2-deoxy-5-keto-D-gluconate 6-phosphate aldolase domain-containing protein n=1 Tax=Caenimonas terrae TaxID=696074 RepID=A0ABW0NED8_9BURK
MDPGYDKPLYLLPFDHRHSYVSDMFKFTPPLSPAQHDRVAASKRVIYEGLLQALADGAPRQCAGILVDEEFGASILSDAAGEGLVTAVSVERSGSDAFEFEYGDAFGQHIDRFRPTFAKALVRYNPDGDAALNIRQTALLRKLSDFCRRSGTRLMFELLVPATPAQMASAAGSKDSYDSQVRPGLMLRSLRALQDAGVEPDVWKIEGLDRRDDCERVVETARRDGRRDVACIVLGRGADRAKVAGWLTTAATVPGFTGFAVGRTTFWDAVAGFEAQRLTRGQAIASIAQRYLEWVAIFSRRPGLAPAA